MLVVNSLYKLIPVSEVTSSRRAGELRVPTSHWSRGTALTRSEMGGKTEVLNP